MRKHPHASGRKPARKKLEDLFAGEGSSPLANAFTSKKVVHPFIGMTPIAEDARESIWQELSGEGRVGKSVAYIHIPFCENHCLFCGFYQNPLRDESASYADYVIKHLRADADKAYQSQGPIHAVYFGGGTPSALPAIELARMIEAVRKYLPLAPDCEITIEGRVHSFTTEKLRAIFDAGANRVSIGVQTFDEKLRRSMGRKGSTKKVVSFLEQAVGMDKGAIVIDLIFGFPGQSISMWEKDVKKVIDLGLDGVDLYGLNLIAGTPLLTAIEKGKFEPTAVADYGQFYECGASMLSAAHWSTISTSHWRRSTRERNIYNQEIKRGANCLAFGAGAGGFLKGYSYRINGDLEVYQAQIAKGDSPIGMLIKQSEHFELFNLIKGEMELGRLNLVWLQEQLKRRAGLRIEDVLDVLLQQWQRSGLLNIKEGWLDLTLAGRFWQVTLTQNLLEWLHQAINDQSETVTGLTVA